MDILVLIARDPLDPSSKVPLWRQLKHRLQQLMASGVAGEGDALPPERNMADALGLSRTTVRRCLDALADEGRIVRTRGRGTFVARPLGLGAARDRYAYSFTAEAEASGREPSIRVLSFGQSPATVALAERLELEEGEGLWEIRRLRLADGEPLAYHRVYVPVRCCPELTRGDAEHSILSALAAKGGIYPSSMDGSYEAIALDSSEARLLRQRAGSPALRLVRTNFATNGMPYEVALTIFRADRYQLRVRSDDGVDSFRKVML